MGRVISLPQTHCAGDYLVSCQPELHHSECISLHYQEVAAIVSHSNSVRVVKPWCHNMSSACVGMPHKHPAPTHTQQAAISDMPPHLRLRCTAWLRTVGV